MVERKVAYMVLADTPYGKTKLGRPRRKRENNIKIYTREVG